MPWRLRVRLLCFKYCHRVLQTALLVIRQAVLPQAVACVWWVEGGWEGPGVRSGRSVLQAPCVRAPTHPPTPVPVQSIPGGTRSAHPRPRRRTGPGRGGGGPFPTTCGWALILFPPRGPRSRPGWGKKSTTYIAQKHENHCLENQRGYIIGEIEIRENAHAAIPAHTGR